jgi:hypothetical protein
MNDGVFITFFKYCEESFCSAYYLEGESSLTEDPTEGALSYALTGRVVNPLKVGGPAPLSFAAYFIFGYSKCLENFTKLSTNYQKGKTFTFSPRICKNSIFDKQEIK